MISLFYPHLHESSGAEAHRRGLVQGFKECNILCVSRNQFSRFDSLRFVLDVMKGRIPYIRMNANSRNMRTVLTVLQWLRKNYILEVNAPHQEDKSDPAFYHKSVRRAHLVVCVSYVLQSYLLPYNENVVVVSNGGQMPSQTKKEGIPSSHFLFIYNAHWHWQSASNIDMIANALQSIGMKLKVVDVADVISSRDLPSNVDVIPSLSFDKYQSALEEAAGFYLEYRPSQDSELGFYGDSLKFRDYWNTNKPILMNGPLMDWAPNPQSPEFGVFPISKDGSFNQQKVFDESLQRTPYGWNHACQRILEHMTLSL